MKRKTHFQFRFDIWVNIGGEIFEHVVGVDDFRGGDRDLSRRRQALACSADHPAARRACSARHRRAK
jgi:hypothetical protein